MIFINIKVIPNSQKSRIVLDASNNIKCYVISCPEDGKANKELIYLFSDKLNIPKSFIQIEKGMASRNKRISIKSFSDLNELYKALDLFLQCKIANC